MSERITSISVPGLSHGSGLAEWGRVSVPDMIKAIRDYSARLRTQADAIDACKDEDFIIETYIGPYAMKNREVLQAGGEK